MMHRTGWVAGQQTRGQSHGIGQSQSHFAAHGRVRASLAQNDRGAVRHGAGLIEHHGTGIPEACAGLRKAMAPASGPMPPIRARGGWRGMTGKRQNASYGWSWSVTAIRSSACAARFRATPLRRRP